MAPARVREVCFLIGRGGAVLYADTTGSPGRLADSRARWEAIWRHRAELEEIAHSHPHGPAAFSEEDETTMSALTSALARAPRFSVVAPEGMVARSAAGPDQKLTEEPWWTGLLRLASGMELPDQGEM